jgi:hypothetical protein
VHAAPTAEEIISALKKVGEAAADKYVTELEECYAKGYPNYFKKRSFLGTFFPPKSDEENSAGRNTHSIF